MVWMKRICLTIEGDNLWRTYHLGTLRVLNGLIKVIPQEKSYQTIFFKLPLNVANQFLFQKIQ